MQSILQFRLLICFVGYNVVSGQTNTATLIVPVSGKCGENTELACQHTAQSCQAWGYRKGSKTIYSQVTTGSTKYTATSRKLTIINTELNDADNYICYCDSASQVGAELKYECKPKDVTQQVTSNKKLSLSVNPVYPEPTQMSVTLNNPLSGNYNCISSPSLSSHFRCTWTSSSSLVDVDGGYRVVVTTVTQTALHGNIKIVTPGPPNITNREQLTDSRWVIRATEDSQVTLECVLSGGIPAPTVAWYRDSISTSPLSGTSTWVQQGDGTYRVTLTHTINASRSDDLKKYVCRSYYPQATSTVTQGSRETTVLLYLNLRPSKPTITQTNTPVSTGTMTLQCRTSGGRPAPTVTWTYRGQTFIPQVQSDKDVSTETYSVLSTLLRPVIAADNGEPACHVNNAALTSERTTHENVVVKFPVSPDSTVITGNREIIATGSNPLDLNCTTGSSNPASTITWRRGSTVIPNSNPVNSWTGTNRDSPEILPMTGITVDEGQVGVVLPCIVSSNPVSTITWYHGVSNLVTGQGTTTGDGYNSLNYTLATVSRDDQGTYRCRADNLIGSAYNRNVEVNVRYVTVTADNTTTSSPRTTVTCTLNNFGGSFKSKPWVQKWQQSNGEYVEVNSIPFSTTLHLTQLTYQHSGVYICMVKAGESGDIYVQGKITLLVKGEHLT